MPAHLRTLWLGVDVSLRGRPAAGTTPHTPPEYTPAHRPAWSAAEGVALLHRQQQHVRCVMHPILFLSFPFQSTLTPSVIILLHRFSSSTISGIYVLQCAIYKQELRTRTDDLPLL